MYKKALFKILSKILNPFHPYVPLGGQHIKIEKGPIIERLNISICPIFVLFSLRGLVSAN